MVHKNDLAFEIKHKAKELGYLSCGITDANPFEEYATQLQKRMNNYPQSRHLYEKLLDRAFPKKSAEWAKSIIVCIRRYGKYRIPQGIDNYIGKYYLVDGRLEYSKEYSSRLMFESFLRELGLSTLTNGITDRWAAVRAGIGRFGKNNFIYTKYGSWIYIDTWIVNNEMEYDEPLDELACPENCTRCIDSCPTKALAGPLMMNWGICIAHLTYHISDLPPESLRDKMGTWLYGCDVCQNVCPLNAKSWHDQQDFPKLSALAKCITPENIFKMDEETYKNVINPRFWYIDSDSMWIWKCNALRAMANSGTNVYHKYIKDACNDDNKNIKQMAIWAYDKLGL